MNRKEKIWNIQNRALRSPSELFGTTFKNAGITKQTLKFNASPAFVQLLYDLNITLIVSREYENLLIALNSADSKKISQSFFHLPHPSGIAIERKKNVMYVAATRNPNQIIEFKVSKGSLRRLSFSGSENKFLIPARTKFYPGEYYFHDLALCKSKLYANSVGMNCIIKVDLSNSIPEEPFWWPKCVEKKGIPDTRANYIQLNSIAIGKDFESSFFCASGTTMSAIRPGHLNYPVDKSGVIFSGKTKEVIGVGLTRPHSSRLYKNKIWVANSGYGEVGFIMNRQFKPVFKFNGWTRGLCFIQDVLFVGVSRVLPKYKHYAPGIRSTDQICSIVAINLKSNEIIGEINFPYGNQIFAIDYFNSNRCSGFPFNTLKNTYVEDDIFSISC